MRNAVILAILAALCCTAVSGETEDPYLWLEDIDGSKAMAWVLQQNERSSARLHQVPEFAPIRERFEQIYDSAERIPYASFKGEYLYNFWQDADHPRGLWRRTTLAQYRSENPSWETLLDLDKLSQEDGQPWVFKGSNCLPPSDRHCMIKLSPGGTDAAIQREFDTLQKQWVVDGFSVPLAKANVAWRDADSLWIGTDFGAGSLTTSGYPRQTRIWRRGTPLEKAELVLEIPADWVTMSGISDHQPGRRYDYIQAIPEFFRSEYHLLVDGKRVKLDLPSDVDFQGFYRDYMLITLRSDWQAGEYHYAAGSLLAIRTDSFLAGARRFDLLFTPDERVSLQAVSAYRRGIVVSTLDNVRGQLYTMTTVDNGWQRTEIPLPGPGSASVTAASLARDEWFFSYTDFLTPTTLYLVDNKLTPVAVKRVPGWFDADGMQTRQYEAKSRDGTRIPYFVVTPHGFRADGSTPTVLYGYGGFEVPMLPRYSGTVGSAWLERGGVWVLANIRGGGEFGPSWHASVLKENRHKVYEDFLAVAEDLIARRITSPRHLGIMGGSQGGLLVGAATMLRPQLFNAAVSQVPLLDMKRYNKLLAGASWMSEYGNPDDPAQWAFIREWSPYQLLDKEAKYPEMFIWTTTRDDRVHPGHARKMAAKMIAQGHPVLYYERVEGGHGSGSTNAQRAENAALEWAYLWMKLGGTLNKRSASVTP